MIFCEIFSIFEFVTVSIECIKYILLDCWLRSTTTICTWKVHCEYPTLKVITIFGVYSYVELQFYRYACSVQASLWTSRQYVTFNLPFSMHSQLTTHNSWDGDGQEHVFTLCNLQFYISFTIESCGAACTMHIWTRRCAQLCGNSNSSNNSTKLVLLTRSNFERKISRIELWMK